VPGDRDLAETVAGPGLDPVLEVCAARAGVQGDLPVNPNAGPACVVQCALDAALAAIMQSLVRRLSGRQHDRRSSRLLNVLG
jgi:hypothetical protein